MAEMLNIIECPSSQFPRKQHGPDRVVTYGCAVRGRGDSSLWIDPSPTPWVWFTDPALGYVYARALTMGDFIDCVDVRTAAIEASHGERTMYVDPRSHPPEPERHELAHAFAYGVDESRTRHWVTPNLAS